MSAPTDTQLDPERAPDVGFESLWQRVQDDWDDDKVHNAFLEYARTRFLLPEAGARYRKMKEDDPSRAEVVDKKLGALMALALSMLESERSEPTKGTPRWLTFVTFAICLGLLLLLAKRVFLTR